MRRHPASGAGQLAGTPARRCVDAGSEKGNLVKPNPTKVLVPALVAVAATVAVASPSSALQRDVCMDQLHYWQKVSWYENRTYDAAEVLMAWQDAATSVNAAGSTEWTVLLPTGPVTATSIFDYSYGLGRADFAWQTAHSAELAFVNSTTVCM